MEIFSSLTAAALAAVISVSPVGAAVGVCSETAKGSAAPFMQEATHEGYEEAAEVPVVSAENTAEETVQLHDTVLQEEEVGEQDAEETAMPPQPEQNSPLVGYNDSKSWWFKRNTEKVPPSAQGDINVSQYGAYYLGDVSRKVIYLTFDEGYENGCTSEILDILKDNDVKAAFFVTKSYIESEPELVKRMVAEGHIVGNHSVTHPQMSSLTDEEIENEILGCAQYFKEVTGEDMPPFFRPPEGEYSIRTLEKTHELGYKTIFWSFAYKDWLVDDQPGAQAAYDWVMDYTHNGCITLLHAVSTSNTQALDRILKDLKAEGYVFETLYDLPETE